MAPPNHFGLTAARWMAVNGFIAGIIGLQFLEVARQGEHWPYAQYAMYASEHGGNITWYRVYGVTPTGEFPLDRDEYFPPFDPQRLSYAFAPRPPRRDLVVPPTPELLQVVGRLYERARLAGRHDGPPLTGLRAYKLTWQLDRTLANRDRPEQELLGEVATGE
jgi:hypothetical protein